jgi:hypothetical protein
MGGVIFFDELTDFSTKCLILSGKFYVHGKLLYESTNLT